MRYLCVDRQLERQSVPQPAERLSLVTAWIYIRKEGREKEGEEEEEEKFRGEKGILTTTTTSRGKK